LTVVAWRIGTDAPDYTADDLSGEGARRDGGRWNRIGTPALYASESIALACLETVAHLGVGDLPLNRYLVAIAIPDAMWAAAERFVPVEHAGWDAIPAGKVSLDYGDAWALQRRSLLLIVPSVIVPEERNFVINPRHPDSSRLRTQKRRRFTYEAILRSGQ
jgi:RES domain-containing protein